MLRRWLGGFLLCGFMIAALTPPVGAWGDDGHRWINAAAATVLPDSMPHFLKKAKARLAYLGPEPDRWREAATEPQLKFSQEPDHFFDSELVPSDFGELPDGRYRFITRMHERRAAAIAKGVEKKKTDDMLPEKVGFQPYITLEIYGRLKVAFREYRKAKKEGRSTKGIEQNAVLYAGWLGHYVADGAQPLHTTIHYNGWVGENPNGYNAKRGIHSDFESRFVREALSQKGFVKLVKAPKQLNAPFQDYQTYLKDSNGLVETVYQMEKAGAFQGKGTAEGQDFVNARLAAGAQMLADLWYTAWMESAVEPPPYRGGGGQ